MTTGENGNQTREAVGVFGDADTMQQAINDLLSSGFDHADLSLLASEDTVEEKLGHKYKKVAEIEDDADSSCWAPWVLSASSSRPAAH